MCAIPGLCIMTPGRCHLWHGLTLQACVAPNWWSSRASSLSRPCDATLVLISALLDWPAQVAPQEGCLFWAHSIQGPQSLAGFF